MRSVPEQIISYKNAYVCFFNEGCGIDQNLENRGLIFGFWFFYLKTCLRFNGRKYLDKSYHDFLVDQCNCVSFIEFLSIERGERIKRRVLTKRHIFASVIFYLAIKPRSLYLDGKDWGCAGSEVTFLKSFLDRWSWVGFVYQENIKNFLLKGKKKQFVEWFRSSYISDQTSDDIFVLRYIPDLFFKKTVFKKRVNGTKNLFGSPNRFLYDPLWFGVFYSRHILQISGRQHGSGYGQWKFDAFEWLERRISTEFELWGLGLGYPMPGRFCSEDTDTDKIKLSLGKIWWIGRAPRPPVDQVLSPSCYEESTDWVLVNRFLTGFGSLRRLSFVKHPRYLIHGPYRKIQANLHFGSRLGIENSINRHGDVVLFDTFSSTAMFWCLANAVPFFIIAEGRFIQEMTSKYNKFFSYLRIHGFIATDAKSVDLLIGVLRKCETDVIFFENLRARFIRILRDYDESI